jgi:2-oxoglutarate ferredoxin oxidoreductase subunit beta
MVSIDDYGTFETAWCPGCGNFSILKALKQALAGLKPRAAPGAPLLRHRPGGQDPALSQLQLLQRPARPLPAAGPGGEARQPRLTVIAESGDGCHYGEGGNHFLAAIRRNVDLTMLAHDNQSTA